MFAFPFSAKNSIFEKLFAPRDGERERRERQEVEIVLITF
jgi:hypothetical protein